MKMRIGRVFFACETVLAMIAVAASLSACVLQFNEREYRQAYRVLENKEDGMSKEEAIKIMRKATRTRESRYACNSIGVAYLKGEGVEKDTVQALKWFEKSAREGGMVAYYNLAMMYRYGWGGVQTDVQKAFRYLSLGAEKKDKYCMYGKGCMLYSGIGCSRDYKAAAELFHAAAEKRSAAAFYMLWQCYKNGQGVEKDSVTADACLRKAAELGNKDAREELKK